jgi:hypothetical protein
VTPKPEGSSSLKNEIQEWLIVNTPHIKELTEPYKKNKLLAFQTQEVVFHDEIERQYRQIVTEIIGVEISKSIGCSLESFYDTIDDETWEELWRKIF